MIKVKALIVFDDYLEHVTRNIGDIFEVTEQRYNEIITKGGPWVEVIEDEEPGEIGQDLSRYKRAELEKIAIDKGILEQDIKDAANKEELIKLIKGLA